MTIYEMEQALLAANQTLKAADNCALVMAKALKGRLRKVSEWDNATLKALKKELSQFNAATGKWKDQA